jgi:hypothetical protein
MDLVRLAGGDLHHADPAGGPGAFAAAELARYLGRLGNAEPVRRPATGPAGAWLALMPRGTPPPSRALGAPATGEWEVRPAGDGLAVAATSPRALLAGVYALLEAAGCRWSPLGAAGEHVPGPAEVVRALPPLLGRPAFARRSWASDLLTWHYTVPSRLAERLPADLAFVDWMAKTGATGFLFIRHANDDRWVVPEVAAALVARGLEVEPGGHALVELLPRERFATHPEEFPAGADGRRRDDGNACASSPGALAVVAERARAACAAIPGARGLHLWGLDLLGGGWCHCAGCAPLAPSDQALRLANAAAEGLGDGRHVFHLAYHDTLRVPRAVRPHPAVWAEFAPRERCYAHAIDEPTCARNASYREALERHLDHFAGRVDVFEYYADAILFLGCAVPLTEVIARDLAHYARAGVRGVSCLTFGTYSLTAYGVNVEAFARGVHDPAAVAHAPAVYCTGRFGPRAETMRRYLGALEAALRHVVIWGDVALPPRRPDPARAAHAALGAALREGPALRRLLGAASTGAPGPHVAARLAAEARLLAYTLAALAALRDWVAARLDPTAPTGRTEEAIARLAAAAADVRAAGPAVAGTWGTYDLELVQAFYAAALRAAPDDHDPFG